MVSMAIRKPAYLVTGVFPMQYGERAGLRVSPYTAPLAMQFISEEPPGSGEFRIYTLDRVDWPADLFPRLRTIT